MAGAARGLARFAAVIMGCGGGGVMVGIVVVDGSIGVVIGNRLDRIVVGRSFTRDTRAQQRMEVAAAKRHRYREQHGHQKPEWTVAMEHTYGEYTGLHHDTSQFDTKFAENFRVDYYNKDEN